MIASGNVDTNAMINGKTFEQIIDDSDKVQFGDADKLKKQLGRMRKGQEYLEAIHNKDAHKIDLLSEAAKNGEFSPRGSYYTPLVKDYNTSPLVLASFEGNVPAAAAAIKAGTRAD